MNEIIEQLVNTRINGNSIQGNATYERMLKRVTRNEIVSYGAMFHIAVTASYKLDCIEQIRNGLES